MRRTWMLTSLAFVLVAAAAALLIDPPIYARFGERAGEPCDEERKCKWYGDYGAPACERVEGYGTICVTECIMPRAAKGTADGQCPDDRVCVEVQRERPAVPSGICVPPD